MGGSDVRVFEIRSASLEPIRLSAPSRIRARDIANVFAPKFDGPVTAVALPPRTLGAGLAPTSLRSFGTETYLTLRAVLGRSMAEGRLLGEDGRFVDRDGGWLRSLVAKGLIATATSPARAGTPSVRLPVGSLGHLRTVGVSLDRGLLVNTHFFVLSTEELDDPFAAIGDPFGLDAAHGTIRNPPTVRRSALLRTTSGWSVRQLGAEDIAVTFPGGTVVRGQGAGGGSGPNHPHFRYRGDVHGSTEVPDRDVALAVCLQGDRASVLRVGGGLRIPHGALVVTFPEAPTPSFLAALSADPRVRFSVPAIPDLSSGVQAGPELVRGGDVVVNSESFGVESFRTLGEQDPVGPVVFPADHDRTPAARVGVGVLRDGTLVTIVVEGAATLSSSAEDRPAGCTLAELALLLQEAGCVDATNLDGGGSAQLFQGAGALLSSADSRGVTGASFDRPVPVAAYLTGTIG